MGLTHYWKRPSVLPTEAFGKAAEDCRKVLAASGIALAGFDGKGKPVLTSIEITFNGAEPREFEPFSVKIYETPRQPGMSVFCYCKTEKLPYDLCVKAALVVLAHYMGDVLKVMSDDSNDGWQDARRLCMDRLGYGDDFLLFKEQ